MKFKEMNKSQLNSKLSELNIDISDIEQQLSEQSAKLVKVCKIADFDIDLAEFSKKELKEIGITKPTVVETISCRVTTLKTKKEELNGMKKAVNYYLNGGQ